MVSSCIRCCFGCLGGGDGVTFDRSASFPEQASEVIDQMWPVILVVGVMIGLQRFVGLYFGAATAQGYVLPGYLSLASASAAFHLFQEGHIEKVFLFLVFLVFLVFFSLNYKNKNKKRWITIDCVH